tara:strand:+ start:210 stop:944 length:735 start_codon:yes stop_codon:yes gene_type:complete
MATNFGKLLRKFRRLVGVKSAKVAEVLGVSRAYITTIENGKQPAPTFKKCEMLIKLLKLNEKEKLDFYIAAFDSRSSNDTKLFLEEIKRLMTISNHEIHERFLYDKRVDKTTLDVSIPLIEAPTKKVVPPYSKSHILKYISLSEIMSGHYYAIYAKPVSSDYFGYGDKDIILIDSLYQALSSGDLVYVKIGRKIQIQEYCLLQTNSQLFIQFMPHCNKENLLFDPVIQKEQFEVLGKVILTLKY